MIILCQDKHTIVNLEAANAIITSQYKEDADQKKDIYMIVVEKPYMSMNGNANWVLGRYYTKDRVQCILRAICNNYADGVKLYIMPDGVEES